MNTPALLDNSAWARLSHAALGEARAMEIADALEAGRIFGSLPVLLETGYSARDARDHEELLAELLALPQAHVDRLVEQRAVDGQRQLARAGHHRLPPVDLLMAALAERHALAVLHYDADYDVIAAQTDLKFEGEWLAPRGSL